MRGRAYVFVLCLAFLVLLSVSASAQYVIQSENILTSSEWTIFQNGTSVKTDSLVPRMAVADQFAYGGGGLLILDDRANSTPDDARLYIQTTSSEAFNGTATFVFRVKCTGDTAFNAGKPYQRNIIMTFVPPGSTRRALGFGITPNNAFVCNITGQTLFGEVPGDNTHYVTWTIVGRDYGASCDVYRDGVWMLSAANTATPEAMIGSPDGMTIGSAGDGKNDSGVKVSPTGSWIFDYVAFKPGEDPGWKPLGDPAGEISGVVSDATNPTVKIANATVRVNSGQTATSDSNGLYTITGLDPESYTITVSADGYYAKTYSDVPVMEGAHVLQNLKLVPLPTATTVVTDTFSRMTTPPDLGTTEDPLQLPWIYTGEVDSSGLVTASVTGDQLALGPLPVHGVSIGGAFQPDNLDLSVDMGPLYENAGAETNWGGVAYRQTVPCVFDAFGGQTAEQAGYLVWCPPDGKSVYLWRNGAIATAITNIDWYSPHRLRVIAVGGHHEVHIDGVKIIDAYDDAKLTGGYVGLLRDNSMLFFDNLSVGQLPPGGFGSVAGKVYEAGDPSKTIAGAVIYFSDGKYAVTDAQGNYSAPLTSFNHLRMTAKAASYLDKLAEMDPLPGVNTQDFALDVDSGYYPTIGALKASAALESAVSIYGKVITSQWNGNTLYVEEPDRSAGIEIRLSSVDSALYTKRSKVVGVQGTLRADPASGELFIQAASLNEPPVGQKSFLKPVIMTGREVLAANGADVTGLDVKVVGTVKSVNNPTDFTIDDGSGELKVVMPSDVTLDPWPVVGDFVEVEGIVSLDGATPATSVRVIKPWHSNTNLLAVNGDFESSNPMSWWGYDDFTNGSCTLTWDTTNPHSGTTCAEMVNTYGYGPNKYGHLYRMTPGPIMDEEYEISCWARGTDVVDTTQSDHVTDWNNWTFNFPAGTFDWQKVGTSFRYEGCWYAGGFHTDLFIVNCNIVNFGTLAVDDWYLGFARGTVRTLRPGSTP